MRRPTEAATATRRSRTDFVVSHPSPLRHRRSALKEAARLGLFAGARVRRRARLPQLARQRCRPPVALPPTTAERICRQRTSTGCSLASTYSAPGSRSVEAESDAAASESKTQKEAIDLKELRRVDRILMALQKKVPPAPPPPPYPDGYVPPSASEEKSPDDLLASEALPATIDPIIDQGPAKRPRLQ